MDSRFVSREEAGRASQCGSRVAGRIALHRELHEEGCIALPTADGIPRPPLNAVLDKNTGKMYYHNRKAKVTQWNEPDALRKQRKKSPWRSRVDPKTGKTYYYNKQTKETTWTKPENFDGVPAKQQPAKTQPAKTQPAAKPKPVANPKPAFTAKPATAAGPAMPTVANQRPAFRPQAEVKVSAAAAAARKPVTRKPAAANPTAAANPGPTVGFQRARFSDSDDDDAAGGGAADGDDGDGGENGEDEEGFDDLADTFDKALEKNNPTTLGAMVQLRHQIMCRKERKGDDEESDDEDAGAPGYELTKHRKGYFKRLLRIGKPHDADKLLTFKKSLIKKSLLKMNRPHDEMAIQMFKNIMSFMGDRKSTKPPVDHARKIIKNALKAPIGMRDEVFLQICKQTHGHPNVNNCQEGWNLMLVCLCAFPPSKNIKVSEYLKKAVESSTSTEIKERAELARVLLDVIEQSGERQNVPTKDEVEAVRNLRLIDVKVRLTDGQEILIKVDPFSTVGEAEKIIQRRLGLRFTQAFGLFEAAADTEDLLASDQRLQDVVSSWDKSMEEEEEAEDLRKAKKKKKKKKVEEPERPRVEYTHLLYQAKLSLNTSGPDKVPDLLQDSKAINMLYDQATRDVLEDRIIPEERDVTRLAALKLQVDEGDYMPDIHRPGFLLKNMRNYIPGTMMPKNPKSKNGEAKLKTYEQKITHKYEKLKGFTPQVAKRNFLDYVERWPTYGTQFFEVRQKKQLKSYPEILNLGISPNGVLLQNPQDKEVLDNWDYKEVVTYGASENKFILVVGDVVQQKRLFLFTSKGFIMRSLIRAYIQYKVEVRMKAASGVTS